MNHPHPRRKPAEIPVPANRVSFTCHWLSLWVAGPFRPTFRESGLAREALPALRSFFDMDDRQSHYRRD